jgi:hypothetical protein
VITRRPSVSHVAKKRTVVKREATQDPLWWHTRDGIRVWTTPKLRHPTLTVHERDGPIHVVLLADYESLLRAMDETVKHMRGR